MNNEEYLKRFAENLLALREYKDLTKKQVAAELGMHRETYALYEGGQRSPSFAATVSIAEFFQVDLSDMLQKDAMDIIAQKRFFDSLKSNEKAFIFSYRKLSPFSKGRLIEFTKTLYLKEIIIGEGTK